jgi:hypothetical protein
MSLLSLVRKKTRLLLKNDGMGRENEWLPEPRTINTLFEEINHDFVAYFLFDEEY